MQFYSPNNLAFQISNGMKFANEILLTCFAKSLNEVTHICICLFSRYSSKLEMKPLYDVTKEYLMNNECNLKI